MPHWARFRTPQGRVGLGVLEDGSLREHEGDFFSGARPNGVTLRPDEFQLLSPCEPSKIIALWNNFHALAAKLGKAPPQHPMFLIKPGTSLNGPGQPIRRPAGYRGKIAYEGELAIVIGRRCSDVSEADAAQFILGYTCINDVTAMEVLAENPDFVQWCRSKGYDTFGCVGPVIATQIDFASAHVTTRLDGVERQRYPLSDMILTAEQQVSRISHDMTLLPGDLIACGTSLGVGTIKDGCTVEVSIEGIGTLTNRLGGG